jgi:lambda repressor-like predicted transcriptional regulator
MEPTVDALREALVNLLSLAPLARQEAILRTALIAVLTDSSAPSSALLSNRAPALSVDDWVGLRAQIRAELAMRGMSMGDLAQATGLARSSLEHCLSPKGVPPGQGIAAALSAWLANRAESVAPAAGNGHAEVERQPRAGRLTSLQIQCLTNHLSLMDEKSIRKTFGLSLAVVDQACLGKELPSEAVERITAFLDAG